MNHTRGASPGCALLLAACGAVAPTLPDGMGRGLLQADATPPAGAVVFERPTWREGCSFTLARGDVVVAKFVVTARSEHGYTVRGPGSVLLERDLDLGNLGERDAASGEPLHLLSPADVRFHWPLWLGKRWSCEFVDRVRGGPAMTMLANYQVESMDTVTVPAGTYEALRIVRQLRLRDAGERVLTRTQVVWYAPSIGVEVRQILGDTAVELLEWQPGP